MRACPSCRRIFEEDVPVCPEDGATLVAADEPASDAAEVGALPFSTTLQDLPAAVGDAVSPVSTGRRSQRRTPSSRPPGASERSSGRVRVRAGAGSNSGERSLRGERTATIEDPLIGATLQGRYKVTRKVGEGGMGAVYEAQHTLIGKRVAVKVLLERYAQKTDIVARLQQEAQVASSIGNEHIVDITDFGETEDGRTFVVMEFLEGESLADLIAREAPLPPERAIGLIRQVANALGAAHEKGIVHRDVKPENIFLVHRADKEFVKVVDFGISKILRPGDEELQRLTQTGMVLGTPLYMSPEQARGEEDLDHRIDIYALGVILYEAVTGEVPFRGKNSLVIINQVLAADPKRPRELRPDLAISEALEAVILHAMAKDRRRRYQSMADLEADLERLQAGELDVGPMLRDARPGVQTGTFARRAGERWLQIGALAVVLAATGIAVRASLQRQSDPLPQVPIPPTDPPTSVLVPPAPPAPPTPARVSLVVTANVDGAQVFYKGPGDSDYRRLGTTPLTGVSIERSTEPGFLRITREGYETVDDLEVTPSKDVSQAITLRAVPHQAVASRTRHPQRSPASAASGPLPQNDIGLAPTLRPR